MKIIQGNKLNETVKANLQKHGKILYSKILNEFNVFWEDEMDWYKERKESGMWEEAE